MSSPALIDDSLSLAEVDAMLRALSPADWARALRLARFRAGGLADWTGDDLLSEAFVRLLAGERIWRRGVSTLQTLKNVLHSLASNERKKQIGAPIDRHKTVDVGAGNDEDESLPTVVTVDDRSPESIIDSRSQLAEIQRLVADDEDIQMLLMAWSDGVRGKAAAEELGFDMKRYDAARKRLERKLEPIADLRRPK